MSRLREYCYLVTEDADELELPVYVGDTALQISGFVGCDPQEIKKSAVFGKKIGDYRVFRVFIGGSDEC